MKPVDQTIFFDGDATKGNCYAACIASLLEVPLETVPDHLGLERDGDPDEHLQRINAFLVSFGLGIVIFDWNAGEPWFVPADALHVLSGPSPRGDYWHATVGRGGSMVYDPHPSRAGLAGTKRMIDLFVILDPRRPSPLTSVPQPEGR